MIAAATRTAERYELDRMARLEALAAEVERRDRRKRAGGSGRGVRSDRWVAVECIELRRHWPSLALAAEAMKDRGVDRQALWAALKRSDVTGRAARHAGLTWRRRGDEQERPVADHCRWGVRIGGVTYRNAREAATALKCDLADIRNSIRRGHFVQRRRHRIKVLAARVGCRVRLDLAVDGGRVGGVQRVCRRYGVTTDTVRAALASGWFWARHRVPCILVPRRGKV